MFTPKFRMNFPVLLKPELKDKKRPEKGYGYRVEALFPFAKTDPQLAEMLAAATQLIYDNHGTDASKWPAASLPDGTMGKPGSGLRSPFRDQSERAKEGVLPNGYVAGNCMMKFQTTDKYPLLVVDSANKDVIDQHQVYSGRWARADVTPGYYNNESRGVTFYLNAIQILENDKPLDGRPDLRKIFAPVAGAQPAAGAPNPFA